MKRTTPLCGILTMFIFLGYLQSICQAQAIIPGSYQLNDGTVNGVLNITPHGGAGSYMFEGGVKHLTSSAECMMSGPATLKGNELEIGYKCSVRLTASEREIVIDDYKKCIPCDPGAYVSGTYKKQ